MKLLYLSVLALLLLQPLHAGAQEDSLATKYLDELVVTATRSERLMGSLPMPVSVILQSQIRLMGSLRLNDALQEQTGLVVVPQIGGQGSGIQLQGLNPDYTLILLNGEPLIGRSAGTLDLSRVTAGNIKKIEIVKGPSSSLYGSEALAGVINIITESPSDNQLSISSRYGSNETFDLNTTGTVQWKSNSFTLFGNRYQTGGYDLSPESYGQTVSPLTNYSSNGKLSLRFNKAFTFDLFARYFTEKQILGYEVATGSRAVHAEGTGTVSDWNVNPIITHRSGDNIKTVLRLYSTEYKTQTQLHTGVDSQPYYSDSFQQAFIRPEITTEYFINETNVFTGGAGFIREAVLTSRYGDGMERQQNTGYGFMQYELQPDPRTNLIGGVRFDHNSVFGSQISPKFSGSYDVSKRITLKASYGLGFKAPDFRQLYLNFNNAAGGGYFVFGSEVVVDRLRDLEDDGQVQYYLLDPSQIGLLQAERSHAINLGASSNLGTKARTEVNLFYNSINNLIETQAVAITASNQTIYSYKNIRNAYTTGLEADINYQILPSLRASAGYQLLFARDRDVVQDIKEGSVFRRDPDSQVTKRISNQEYFGLYNRSRHAGNLKFFYLAPSGWAGSLRIIYRGKFGVGDLLGNTQGGVIQTSDKNNNSILDVHDDFVQGYVQTNISVSKTISRHFEVQSGVDNLFGYTDALFQPQLPGRIYYITVRVLFKKNQLPINN